MSDLKESIQREAMAITQQQNSGVFSLIDTQSKSTTDVKTAIDLLATREALSSEENVDKIVKEKNEELRNDAEKKRIEAETAKINEEVNKTKAQAEKELAEIEKQIQAKRKEVEELKAESDKEDAYFTRNKEILKYVNIRSKKTLKVMKTLMFPATIIFFIVQVLLFPVTFTGLVLENIVNIIGGICGAIKNNVWRILMAILVILIIGAVCFCVYYFGLRLIQ